MGEARTTMKINKIISVERIGNPQIGEQAEWEVIFEANGKAFKIERLVQFNEPQLQHIQDHADQREDWFWNFWAKAIIL